MPDLHQAGHTPDPGEPEDLPATPPGSSRSEGELARALERAEADSAPRAAYLEELERRPPPDRELERELVVSAQRGDMNARARLVEEFMPLIASVARTYRTASTIEERELLQEGVVGLLRALQRYDPQRETPFWAYARWWVRQAMQQLVSELTRPAVLSDRALRHLARLKDAYREMVGESGREPSRAALAERAGLDVDQIDNLIAVDRPSRSTEDVIAFAEGAVGTFGELLVDPLAEGEYERVLNAIEAEELLALLAGLSDRERAILRARYGLEGDEESLREVGARLGLSAERVRQIEQRALGKLAAAAPRNPSPGVDAGGLRPTFRGEGPQGPRKHKDDDDDERR